MAGSRGDQPPTLAFLFPGAVGFEGSRIGGKGHSKILMGGQDFPGSNHIVIGMDPKRRVRSGRPDLRRTRNLEQNSALSAAFSTRMPKTPRAFTKRRFPTRGIGSIERAPGDYPKSGKAGDVLVITMTILGMPFHGVNGGPEFTFDEAVSFQTSQRSNQEETNRYWNAIVSNGGEESVCGWCARTGSACPGRLRPSASHN